MCKYDVYFWRQVLILSSNFMLSSSKAFLITIPTAMKEALMAANGTDIAATSSEISWISSCMGFGGIFGIMIYPAILEAYGRRVVNVAINLVAIIGWLLLIFGPNLQVLYLGRIVQGFIGGGYVIFVLIVSEYSEPKRRGYFITIMKLGYAVGVMLSHVMMMYLTWRQISGFCIATNAYSMFSSFFWPESPSHLAKKGRFEECEKSFIWLYGSRNKEELKELIAAQEKRANTILLNANETNTLARLFRVISQRDFLKSLLITVCLAFIIEASGRHYMPAHILQIMSSLLGEGIQATYVSVGVDCVTITALLVSCIIVKIVNRRTVLFTFGGAAVALLLMISLFEYLKSNRFAVLTWLPSILIVVFTITVNLGVLPLCYIFLGEVYALEYRSLMSFCACVVLSSSLSVTLKIFPMLLEATGLKGTVLVCGVIILGSLLVLHFILPETKDRTLQNIENEIKGETSDDVHAEVALMLPATENLNQKST